MPSDAPEPAGGLWPEDGQAREGAPPAEQLQTAGRAVGGDGEATEPEAESDVWVGRTHWAHYIGRLSLWLAGNVVLALFVGWVASRADWLGARGAFWVMGVVVLLSGLIVVGGVAVEILGTRYRLTTQRLFIERGIIRQTVDQTELIRVDDVRISKGVADRLFGLGSVQTLSTDATDRETIIAGIAEPDSVAEAIRRRMRSMRKRSLFVENL